MKKIIFSVLLFPFFVFADDEQDKIDKLTKLNFQKGVVAAAYCHDYYAFGALLFDLKENGDPKGTIPKIRGHFGDKFVDSILNYEADDRNKLKEQQFLNKQFKQCIEKTKETGELQKP